MNDVTEYSHLRQKALSLFRTLKGVRSQIRTMEQRMIQEMTTTQNNILSVTSENRYGFIKLHDRTRRLPLTEVDLKTKLRDCLHEKFPQVEIQKIEEFAVSISNRIWAERRTKRDQKVSLKVV
jgi:hypothetical protein